MRRKLLDILACPIDKHYPLELHTCEAAGENIVEGALFCPRCERFYPIVEEIPIMLPDELRSQKEDLDFLNRWAKKLPEKIVHNSKPFQLARSG
ncbi:MAG: Trm112 family protein [Thaumarchaeota archaeon]|nr:Trm112 family protein [Nitrososphaerota archaeon]